MKPIEQALVEYFDDIEAVLDFRFYATNDVAEILADVFYALLDNVDWLAVANAVAAKKEPVFNGEEISLSDSFVGYNGAPESIEPVVFSIYDTVIDDNTPIEVIERILESGELALRYGYFTDKYGEEKDGNLLVREGDRYVVYIIYEDGSLHRYRRYETLAEAWHFMSIRHGPIKVVDRHETEAGMFESVDLDGLTDNGIGALLERGALHVDDTDDWLAKTLYRVGDGEYAIVFEREDGTLRIDPEDDRCTLKHAVKEFKVVIEDRDVYLIPAG